MRPHYAAELRSIQPLEPIPAFLISLHSSYSLPTPYWMDKPRVCIQHRARLHWRIISDQYGLRKMRLTLPLHEPGTGAQ